MSFPQSHLHKPAQLYPEVTNSKSTHRSLGAQQRKRESVLMASNSGFVEIEVVADE